MACTGGWAPDHSVCQVTWDGLSAPVQAYADAVAILVVNAATGLQFGTCTLSVRPCWVSQMPLYQTYLAVDYGYWGTSSVIEAMPEALIGGCACAAGACGCSPPSITLPGPVNLVSAVRIDGVALNPSAYRVHGNQLIRQDGSAWPTQDLAVAAGAVGSFEVDFTYGVAVPDAVNKAAGLYACEVGKARTGGTCALPSRMSSMTRQGVSVQMIDKSDFLDKGLTGIMEIDQVIVAVNPYHLHEPPHVLSPDLPRF